MLKVMLFRQEMMEIFIIPQGIKASEHQYPLMRILITNILVVVEQEELQITNEIVGAKK